VKKSFITIISEEKKEGKKSSFSCRRERGARRESPSCRTGGEEKKGILITGDCGEEKRRQKGKKREGGRMERSHDLQKGGEKKANIFRRLQKGAKRKKEGQDKEGMLIKKRKKTKALSQNREGDGKKEGATRLPGKKKKREKKMK